MNLETRLSAGLWEAIRTSYQSRNYSGAILDGMHYLGSLIRLKSGIDADGAQLVGQALGGDNPPLKLNKLQTETERNVQRGIEQLIRGLYQAVRNPRSHERLLDTEADADALILFIGYICNIVDKSKGIYSEEEALRRIFDPLFVEQDRYAELMVENIPSKYRLDVLLAAFSRKQSGDGGKLRYTFQALLSKLNDSEKKTFAEAVSDELLTATDDTSLRLTISSLPAQFWAMYTEAARLRAENKLIASIRSGAYNSSTGQCLKGALGTWATGIARYFTLKDQYIGAIADLLRSDSALQTAYACEYFLHSLPTVDPEVSWRTRSAIKHALRGGNKVVKEFLDTLDDLDNKGWTQHFAKERAEFQEKKRSVGKFDDMEDDIPF